MTDLALDAVEQGHFSHVVCLSRAGQLARELPPGAVSVVAQGGLSLMAPVSLARHLRRLQPDVVHLHSGVWFKGAYAARLAGARPVVFTDHGRPHPDPLSHRLLDAIGARLTDCTVAVSSALGRYLVEQLRVPAPKLEVIANGIHLPPLAGTDTRAAVRGELGVGSEFLVGAIGRLDRVKAYHRLIDAFARLARTSSAGERNTVLALVGDGPERAALEQQAADLGLGRAVRFLRWRDDVRRLLCGLDLFVLPSDSEGTSVALLEAMAARVAVVATAVGGTPDVLGDSGAGFLVRPGDTGALAEAIGRFMGDPSGRQAAGRAGRARVESVYSFKSMAGAYSQLYWRLIGHQRKA